MSRESKTATESAATESREGERHAGFAVARFASALAPLAGLILVIVIFYAIPPHRPITLLDLRTVTVHMVIVGIAALGMTLIIISGGIDLSVGSAIALSSVVAAIAMSRGWSLPAAIVAALLTGGCCGLYNGLLITVLRLPPFIATLGTLGFFRGVAKWWTDSRPVSAPTQGLEQWVRTIPPREWMIVSPGVWLLFGLAVIMALVLRRTIFGRYAVAIGSNESTARLCGVRVPRVKVAIYVVAGLLTGIAGVMQFARLTQGDPTVAVGLELDVIAAVVIGGASLSGGQGSLLGALAGAFMIQYLRNRCTVLGLSNFVQDMIVGHIIIVAVAVDQWRLRRAE